MNATCSQERSGRHIRDFASLFLQLPAHSRVRVLFNHSTEEQVITLLSAGSGGGTCYMEASSAWPRSFRYHDIVTAEVVS